MKNLFCLWWKIDEKIRFLIIGVFNAAISYAIFALAFYLLKEVHYQACVALQWAISSIFSYINQKFFVFRTEGNYVKEYLKCCTTWLVSYFANVVILELLVRFVFNNVYVAQFISIFLVSVITYLLFKYFAFKKRN